MSQSEKKRIQSNEVSLESEISQNPVGQDTLMDPILSKESKNTMLVGMDQTAVSGRPEDKDNQDEEPSMNVSNVDALLSKKDTGIKKQSHSHVNSLFRGLRCAYEQFEERSKIEKQKEEKQKEDKNGEDKE